jgi:hypothetical protein
MCYCRCRGWHHNHHGRYSRRFLTKEEQAKDLEEYAEELRKELSAVEEQIKELKS